MLGLGWSEMLVIAVVVLIVVGPKDLPVMLRNLGRMMGSVRRISNEFRREIDKAIAADEFKEAKKAISEPLSQTTAEITREFNTIRNGKVEPSGKIKPSEEGKESVYDEIRAQAGMGEKTAAPLPAAAPSSTAREEQAPAKPASNTAKAATAAASAGAGSGGKVKAARAAPKAAPKATTAKSAGAKRAEAKRGETPKPATTAKATTAAKATPDSKTEKAAGRKAGTAKRTASASGRKTTGKPKAGEAGS